MRMCNQLMLPLPESFRTFPSRSSWLRLTSINQLCLSARDRLWLDSTILSVWKPKRFDDSLLPPLTPRWELIEPRSLSFVSLLSNIRRALPTDTFQKTQRAPLSDEFGEIALFRLRKPLVEVLEALPRRGNVTEGRI